MPSLQKDEHRNVECPCSNLSHPDEGRKEPFVFFGALLCWIEGAGPVDIWERATAGVSCTAGSPTAPWRAIFPLLVLCISKSEGVPALLF